jgi:hypothetical protein
MIHIIIIVIIIIIIVIIIIIIIIITIITIIIIIIIIVVMIIISSSSSSSSSSPSSSTLQLLRQLGIAAVPIPSGLEVFGNNWSFSWTKVFLNANGGGLRFEQEHADPAFDLSTVA